ncbi:MAG: O-antigen ligase family protein [Candidatus Sabulitectum sp.]|nr:O-antigen ligase family protein [Candidatus Sabulitectum sp.]
MRTKVSTAFLVLLTVVMVGVLFGVITNSRNSILVKEMFYVAGGSLASMMAAVLLFLGKPCYKQRIPVLSLGAVGAVLLLMVIMHFAGIGSINGPFTFLMLLSLASLTVSSILFIDEAHVKLFTSIMLGSTSIMFVYAIMQWQGINIFSWDASLTRSGRSTGSLGNPNLLGGFASAIIPLGAAYLFSLKKFSPVLKTSMTLLFVALATTSVVASGTRGSVIGVVAGSVVLLLWFFKNSSKSFRKLIPFVLLLLVVIAAVAVPMASRLSELDPTIGDQGTLQVRKIIWSGTFNLFIDSPLLGHGPGSFQILFPEYRNPFYSILGVSHNTLHAHCEYLEILVDIGIIGLILWAVAAWGIIGQLRKADLFRAGAFAGMAAMLAEGLVSIHLRWPPTAWLFATMAMIFLSRECNPVPSGRKSRSAAVGLALVSLILAAGFFVHYLPITRSSELVFKGKDMFLVRTEMAMNGAYSAAAQWMNSGDEAALNSAVVQWQNASIFADSAVAYSREATEVYTYDLGGWYALGSAHLTRYMVMAPPVPAMRSALEAAGLPSPFTPQEIRDELLLGMAAYDSLTTMAPNYAEVHNNLALGYSNLGMLDESMEELYKSYKIHAHRRGDYYDQVSALLAIHPSSFYGVVLYFHHSLMGYDTGVTGGKREMVCDLIVNNAWFLVSCQPTNKAALQEKFIALLEEIMPAEHSDPLIDRVRNIEGFSPFALWDSKAVLLMSDEDAIRELRQMSIFSAFNSSTFPAALPSVRDFYIYPAVILFRSGWDQAVFDSVMDIFLLQIVTDRNLDNVNTLLQSERFHESVEVEVAEQVWVVRMALGGTRTALREGFETPWLAGSLPGLISDTLHSRMENDSLNSQLYQMELRMSFLLVTSYWWDYNIFAASQNEYLLTRIFHCRDMIREIQPVAWPSIVSRILAEEIDRISNQTGGVCPFVVGLLRDDLVSGAARVTEGP